MISIFLYAPQTFLSSGYESLSLHVEKLELPEMVLTILSVVCPGRIAIES